MRIRVNSNSSIKKSFATLERRMIEENYIKPPSRRVKIHKKSYDRKSYLRKKAALKLGEKE